MSIRPQHFADDGEGSDEKTGSEEDIKRLLQRAEQRFSNSETPVPQSSESGHQQRYAGVAVAIAYPDQWDQY